MACDLLLIQPALRTDGVNHFTAISNGSVALAMYLLERGKSVRIAHLNGFDGSTEDFVKEKLDIYSPRVVGINLTWHTHIGPVLTLAKHVKGYSPETAVITGGYTASFFDQQLLAAAQGDGGSVIDLVVRGDAELPVEEFLDTGVEPHFNTSYFDDCGNLIRTPLEYVQKDLPRVHLTTSLNELIDDFSAYLQRGGIRTSVPGAEGKVGHNVGPGEMDLGIGKGCRNNCCYCGGSRDAHRLISARKRVSYRHPGDVARDIQQFAADGVRTVYVDFDPDPSRRFYRALFDRLSPVDMGLMFSCWSGPLDMDILDAIGAKFEHAEFVISPESGSEEFRRELIKRGHGKPPFFTNDELTRFFRELRRRDFKAMCYFMSGLPWETPEYRRATLNFASTLAAEFADIFSKGYDPTVDRNLCAPPLYIEPASPIHREPERFGMNVQRRSFKDFLEDTKAPGEMLLLGGYHERYRNEREVLDDALEVKRAVAGEEVVQ